MPVTQIGAQYRIDDDDFITAVNTSEGTEFNLATHTVTALEFRPGTESTARLTIDRKDGGTGSSGGSVNVEAADVEVQDDFWIDTINAALGTAWNKAAVTVTGLDLVAGTEADFLVTIGPKPA